MKRTILIPLSVLALAIVGYGIYHSQTADNQTTSPSADKVKIAYKKSIPSFPIFVGINEGYFRKYNLEVEPIAFESTNQMIEAIVRGDVDASAVGSTEPALAAEAESPGNFKFYGQVRWDKNNFLDYLMVKRDSPIRSVTELRGKRIGVAPGGASVVYTKLF